VGERGPHREGRSPLINRVQGDARREDAARRSLAFLLVRRHPSMGPVGQMTYRATMPNGLYRMIHMTYRTALTPVLAADAAGVTGPRSDWVGSRGPGATSLTALRIPLAGG
jgi:hypothetical protein